MAPIEIIQTGGNLTSSQSQSDSSSIAASGSGYHGGGYTGGEALTEDIDLTAPGLFGEEMIVPDDQYMALEASYEEQLRNAFVASLGDKASTMTAEEIEGAFSAYKTTAPSFAEALQRTNGTRIMPESMARQMGYGSTESQYPTSPYDQYQESPYAEQYGQQSAGGGASGVGGGSEGGSSPSAEEAYPYEQEQKPTEEYQAWDPMSGEELQPNTLDINDYPKEAETLEDALNSIEGQEPIEGLLTSETERTEWEAKERLELEKYESELAKEGLTVDDVMVTYEEYLDGVTSKDKYEEAKTRINNSVEPLNGAISEDMIQYQNWVETVKSGLLPDKASFDAEGINIDDVIPTYVEFRSGITPRDKYTQIYMNKQRLNSGVNNTQISSDNSQVNNNVQTLNIGG